MLCPYCLKDTPKVATCLRCKEQLPSLYTQGYSVFNPPVVLSAVGFSGHGKTVYLAALLHTLQHRLPRAWPGFYRQGLDQNSIDTVKQNLGLLESGNLPESTRRNFPRPSLHLLDKLPKFNSRQLAIYDPPGEAFEDNLAMEKFASFVTLAKTVVFLVSVVDFYKSVADELHRLMEVYSLGMNSIKANTRRQQQNLVVTFTKADLMINDHFFGKREEITKYLNAEHPNEICDLKNYLARMQFISRELADFTLNDIKAESFFNFSRSHFKKINYCAVSALGTAPEGNRLSEVMQPKRVIDPLLWVIRNS